MGQRDVYRTNDGAAYFTFDFHNVNGVVEIDIIDAPSYGRRSNDLHSTHRLYSSRGGYRICFADPRVASNMERAKAFASTWAERTWRYIQTGRGFDE